LVCESWLRAWKWLEGTPAGFLNDAYIAVTDKSRRKLKKDKL
jgi:hypothetical protein